MDLPVTIYVDPWGRPSHRKDGDHGGEEDLLAELLGREEVGEVETERPWIRVDFKVCASLEYGKGIPMPNATTWAKWSREAISRLENVERLVTDDVTRETSEGHHAILAWQGDPEIKVTCSPLGVLLLESITINAFQGIDLPRRWDDPEREPTRIRTSNSWRCSHV